MEFFLHFLWTRNEFFAKRHDHNPQINQHPAQAAIDQLSGVPLSFNFVIPQTVIIKEGIPDRWYYSNNSN
jgi:hypothetical protein